MSDWKEVKLGDIAHINMGQSPESASYNSDGKGLPLIQGNADIKARKSIQRIWTTHPTKICEVGDILMTVRAPVGSIGISTLRSCLGRGVCGIKASSIHESYLYHLLISKEESWKQFEQGSTFTAVGSKEIFNFTLTIYNSENGQNTIAHILTTCDTVIERTQLAISKYKAIKQGLLHDLFTRGLGADGKLRPRYQDAPELYKESELGWIPREWEVKKLGECCNEHCTYGINAASVDFDSKLPLYLRITDITENGQYNKLGRKCVDDPFSVNYILKENDIVFARTGATVGKTYLYNPTDGILIYAGFLIKFSPNKNQLNSYFLKSFTETAIYWNWVNLYSQRSGQPGINGNEYSSLKLSIPNITEQNEIAQRFKAIDNNIQLEEALLQKYQLIKRGLMGDLLGGKKEVKN